ncbi:MucBP domain-containing protein [Fructilactobacillus hinvesii]|uniref:dextransucrase n=1 Tax=Fructilactobacillus hinvesii TaxID=2940300 RepID=A0ABY5BSI8_9LACO|nr:glycoside hydrolase family 70 protein [Fructilactobacillus hinvesii]USS88032.1 MucBP domain-containing protein [Fructilactobacillus hinvesii]
MRPGQEIKEHYKMYKKGKQWVYACLTVATVALGLVGILPSMTTHADDQINSVNQTSTAVQSPNNSTDNNQSKSNQQLAVKEINDNDSVQSSQKSDDNQQQSQITQTVNTTSNSTEIKYQPISTGQKSDSNQTDNSDKSSNDNHSDVFEKNDSQNKSQSDDSGINNSTNDSNQTQQADSNHQNNLDKNQATDHNKDSEKVVSDDGSQKITSKPAEITNQPNPSTENNDNQEKQNSTPALFTNLNATNQNEVKYDDPHIHQIDGKTYFYDDYGQLRKNFTVVIGGQTLWFNDTTGELTTPTDQFKTGLTTIGNEHNVAYSKDAKNFDNVDGFLTANSWYRPKDIYENGEQWVPSTDSDRRPLLMAWWPDKDTQVAYLQNMQAAGLLPNVKFDFAKADQKLLNIMALTVQKNIEKRITASGNVDWLREDITHFVNSQPAWNIKSEFRSDDHLQGGALSYVNNKLTPNANSDYRLINRNPVNQEGQQKKVTDGYELLLANDIDNSNPAVQAEQLNWLYYMMNLGTIIANDPDAHFDGYRVDAVDNVDADLLKIAGDYFKAAYGINKNDKNANQHLSILEDWSFADPDYVAKHGNTQLTMDFLGHLGIIYGLTTPSENRSKLEPLMTTSLNNREGENSSENKAHPNYNFIRAHDSLVQEVIGKIITDQINPDADGLNPTPDEIKKAFEIYNDDLNSVNKKYALYNVPAAYAMLLTNKDSVPRIYYGDLFMDNGQYMGQHSPYYDALVNLLRSRIKYVAGGQNMNVQYVNGNQSMGPNDYRGVLTSVRYGKGAMTANDLGDQNTRTEGMAVVLSNNKNLKLSDTDKIVINMGAAHRNQQYRAVLLSTNNGLKSYDSDAGAPTLWTNDQGQLILDGNYVYGVSDVQVSGALSVWVPVGAPNNQDARTESSTADSTDGNVYHSNAALDSQMIFEGFSNFLDMPTTTDQYANVKIAQNADFFQSIGITSFELAPQYRPSTDSSFVDSVVKNGYSFTDRYDVGFGAPTKYGTAQQLLDCLKALHAHGMQAIDDWVPDQLYNLPGEEVVAAKRVDKSGNPVKNSDLDGSTLYDSHTVGGGEYQKIYGGAFLDKLKEMYPWIFEAKQVSNGQPMNPDEKIKEWSAKYFNGTNIQGRGAWYVLKDWGSNRYFTVNDSQVFLPKELLEGSAETGFVKNGDNTQYYSTSGYQAKSSFVPYASNWYYFDENGNMVTGEREINGETYFFLPNGVELRDAYMYSNNQMHYFNLVGKEDELPKVGTVNFYFHDENGNPIETNDGHDHFTWQYLAGTDWDYTKWVPQINGYRYDHADQYEGGKVTHTLSGKYPLYGVINVYLTYVKNQPGVVRFHFQDENGNELRTNDGHDSFTWNGEVGQPWDYTKWVPEIDGYRYDHTSQENPTYQNNELYGNYPAEGPTDVYLTYHKQGEVNFYFHDENGNPLQTNDGHDHFTWIYDVSTPWNYKNWIPAISGYWYSHADQYNPTYQNHELYGNYPAVGPTNVYLTYARNIPGIVRFHFHDQDGNEIKTNDGQNEFVWQGNIATPWDYRRWIPEINGYRYDHADQYNPTYQNHELYGNYPAVGPTDVYLTYRKTGTVNFYFHDENGNPLQTNDGHDHFAWNYDIGTPWDYKNWIPEINGYRYDHADQYNPTYQNHELYGNYPAVGPTNVYLTYARNVPGIVRFHFHDQDGNEIKTNDGKSEFVWQGDVSTPWDYHNWIPEINGYRYDHADQYNPTYQNHELSGNYPAVGPTDVYLTYHKTGTVNFYFHDENGKQLQTNDGHDHFAWNYDVGTPWNYTKWIPEINGYQYDHADQDNPTYQNHELYGNYPAVGPTNVYLTYAPAGVVKVYFHDENGNEIAQPKKLTGKVGTKWDYTKQIPEIDGYQYSHADQDNPTYRNHELYGNYPEVSPTNLYLTYEMDKKTK